MKEKVLALLEEEFADIDFSQDALVDDGILDSLTIVSMITTLSLEFGITIPYDEVIPENFNSVDAITELVEKLS
ncbi:MAG: phosphopantetheine-binding protein [Lachnospiraceae bacterium]|nr:phosphopantetheine-binding protein [Lachnospiraceae bacterium]MCD7765589.1 phosphopantetheine-binding protein [Lachnospiraceae bacterium]